MKVKHIVLTVVLAVFCFQAFSQTKEDLIGLWLHTEIDNSDGDLCVVKDCLEYQADGTCLCHGEVHMELDWDESLYHADFTYSAKGTWNLESNIITYKFDPKSIKIVQAQNIYMPGLLKGVLFNPMMAEVKKELRKHSPHRIMSYTPEQLNLLETDDEDAIIDTYFRQ